MYILKLGILIRVKKVELYFFFPSRGIENGSDISCLLLPPFEEKMLDPAPPFSFSFLNEVPFWEK